MAVLAIVIPVIVVLAAIVIFAASRRRDTDVAEGYLSRETVKRDRKAEKVETSALASTDVVASDVELSDSTDLVLTGREVEKAAALARRERGGELVTADVGAPVTWVPPDDEEVGVMRRQFLNRSIIGLMGVSLGGFGAAVVAFLHGGPEATGFGSDITVGKVEDVKTAIQGANGFLYRPEGRMWVTEYPVGSIKKARRAYSGPELKGMEAGLVALFQKCPHLGCRVPECLTSQWFECPCHGSQYNRVGEKRGGPAPRGMDRFAMEVRGDEFVVKTGTIIQGPPIGTNTTGQEAEGPNCLGQSSH